jgi:O-acetyl-ADP-ribose deacetylase (regulator of RNase III)
MILPRDQDYWLQLRISDSRDLHVLRGDLTEYAADAIVNAANPDLLPGGGLCGAIHDKGGTEIARECARLRRLDGPLSPGQAVPTTAGSLRARYVIHTVGPVWEGGQHGEPRVLASAYRASIQVADDLRLQSIALPAISTGIYRYPTEKAATVSIRTILETMPTARHLRRVSVVLYDKVTLDIFAAAVLSQNQARPGEPFPIEIGTDHA